MLIASSKIFMASVLVFCIPDGCAPVYGSKAKPTTKKRNRPAKPETEKPTFLCGKLKNPKFSVSFQSTIYIQICLCQCSGEKLK